MASFSTGAFDDAENPRFDGRSGGGYITKLFEKNEKGKNAEVLREEYTIKKYGDKHKLEDMNYFEGDTDYNGEEPVHEDVLSELEEGSTEEIYPSAPPPPLPPRDEGAEGEQLPIQNKIGCNMTVKKYEVVSNRGDEHKDEYEILDGDYDDDGESGFVLFKRDGDGRWSSISESDKESTLFGTVLRKKSVTIEPISDKGEYSNELQLYNPDMIGANFLKNAAKKALSGTKNVLGKAGRGAKKLAKKGKKAMGKALVKIKKDLHKRRIRRIRNKKKKKSQKKRREEEEKLNGGEHNGLDEDDEESENDEDYYDGEDGGIASHYNRHTHKPNYQLRRENEENVVDDAVEQHKRALTEWNRAIKYQRENPHKVVPSQVNYVLGEGGDPYEVENPYASEDGKYNGAGGQHAMRRYRWNHHVGNPHNGRYEDEINEKRPKYVLVEEKDLDISFGRMFLIGLEKINVKELMDRFGISNVKDTMRRVGFHVRNLIKEYHPVKYEIIIRRYGPSLLGLAVEEARRVRRWISRIIKDAVKDVKDTFYSATKVGLPIGGLFHHRHHHHRRHHHGHHHHHNHNHSHHYSIFGGGHKHHHHHHHHHPGSGRGGDAVVEERRPIVPPPPAPLGWYPPPPYYHDRIECRLAEIESDPAALDLDNLSDRALIEPQRGESTGKVIIFIEGEGKLSNGFGSLFDTENFSIFKSASKMESHDMSEYMMDAFMYYKNKFGLDFGHSNAITYGLTRMIPGVAVLEPFVLNQDINLTVTADRVKANNGEGASVVTGGFIATVISGTPIRNTVETTNGTIKGTKEVFLQKGDTMLFGDFIIYHDYLTKEHIYKEEMGEDGEVSYEMPEPLRTDIHFESTMPFIIPERLSHDEDAFGEIKFDIGIDSHNLPDTTAQEGKGTQTYIWKYTRSTGLTIEIRSLLTFDGITY